MIQNNAMVSGIDHHSALQDNVMVSVIDHHSTLQDNVMVSGVEPSLHVQIVLMTKDGTLFV